MSTAERTVDFARNENILYSRLRDRFCEDGCTTIGERMMQASLRMRTLSTTVFAETETLDSDSAVCDAVTVKENRTVFFRNLAAVCLTTAVMICLAFSFIRMTASADNTVNTVEKSYSISVIDSDNVKEMNFDDNVSLRNAYGDFCLSFEN